MAEDDVQDSPLRGDKVVGLGMSEAETCQRCGHENSVWFAPSPLWNAAMRGGSINGEPLYSDMVCAACFMVIAEEKGVAAHFRVTADIVNVELETVTPSGRVWDADKWLWREAQARG